MGRELGVYSWSGRDGEICVGWDEGVEDGILVFCGFLLVGDIEFVCYWVGLECVVWF